MRLVIYQPQRMSDLAVLGLDLSDHLIREIESAESYYLYLQ